MWLAAVLAAASAIVSWLLAPAVVNGDGLGYLNASTTSGLYPGHLAYLPLLRLARAVAAAGPRPVDGLFAARALSAGSGAIAVLALAAAARRLGGSAAAAGAGLLASFGMLAAASDVETYAPALAALAVAVWAIAHRREGDGPGWLLGAVVAVAAAALLHVENVLFALPAALALPRRDRAPLLAGAALIVGGAYALALRAHGVAWLLGASHGFHYPLGAATPAIAVYGACKALVFSPYPYEASWSSVLACFALGAAALAALAAIVARRPRATAPLGRAAALAWLVPYAAVGATFFASDSERWVFLLPLLWLTVAASRRARAALVVAALMLAANVIVWGPRARDDRARVLARAAARHAGAGDLLLSPGHGWDEYVGFYDRLDGVEHFPLVYYAGVLGGREPLARAIAEAAARARARSGRVLLVRFDDGQDPLGWKELRQFGVTPSTVDALLPPGRRVPLGDGVERLDP